MLKITFISSSDRTEASFPDLPITREVSCRFIDRGTPDEEIIRMAPDTDVLVVDAIAKISAELINGLPQLKMIHSEGVAYNGIDTAAAAARGVPVCNCRAMNAGAVAEQAILLMLGLLRDVVAGHLGELAGEQIRIKERKMGEGITDLADCTVGLVGFGAIAKETARRLRAFGCRVLCWNRTPVTDEVQKEYGVTAVDLDTLLAESDIVSLHTAVAPGTAGMVNEEFIAKMKSSAYLINTARGELVDNEVLAKALSEKKIAGAGFDTIAPEPTTLDNPLLNLPKDCRVLYSPHLGGITTGSFRKGAQILWKNIACINENKRPETIVNGI